MEMNLFDFQLYSDKRRTVSTAFITFVIGISLGGLMWQFGGVYSPYTNVSADIDSLNKFTTYEELKIFLETNSNSNI